MNRWFKTLFYFLFICVSIKSYALSVKIGKLYYSLDGNNAILTSHAKGNTGYYGDIVIPKTVTYNGKTYNVTCIDERAFWTCKGLKTIIIPNSVTKIYDNAFEGCDNLKSITIPNSLIYVGRGAFACAWYDNQPDGIIYVGRIVYSYKGEMPKNSKITIKDGTLGIAGGAFSGSEGLSSVVIPNSVTFIGDHAFAYCSNLKSLVVPNSVKIIGIDAFYDTAWLKNQPDGLVYAGKIAYEYKGKMLPKTKIQIKEGTQGIAGKAFYDTENLESVVIPNSVTYIGDHAFAFCRGLKYISIPSGVSVIDESAFSYCSSLLSVNIPQTVTCIGKQAFQFCTSLTSITIPKNVTTIDVRTFYGCSNLKSIEIPSGVTRICAGAFSGCKGLTSVIIPNNVITIGSEAFTYCSGLTSVTLPNSVTEIGSDVFYGSSNLSSIVIPKNVIYIGSRAFEDTKWFDNQPDGLIYAGSLVYQYKGELSRNTKVKIKEGTLGIASAAFRDCKGLESVIIPNSVKWIYDYAFSGCSNLTSITLPNSIDHIGSSAFENCTSLSSVNIPNSVTSIGFGAFKGCKGLETVTMSSNLGNIEDNIGYYTFKDCNNLETVYASPRMIPRLQEVLKSNVNVIAKDESSIFANHNQVKEPAYNLSATNNNTGISEQQYMHNESITPDIDINIPTTTHVNQNTFAIIIGNEKYQQVMAVPYANNDAKVFAEYCKKTLGLPEKNVRIYENATYGAMIGAVSHIQKIAKAYKGNINVIFYYAGHGIPDEATGDAYLLPIDADGINMRICYPLNQLYKELGDLRVKSVTCFMDCCFSGAERGNGMVVAARGVAIKVKSDQPVGNTVVFTAATDKQTAFPYKEKGHGMFTYYLLKKLRDTKGDCTLGELGSYISDEVAKQAVVTNGKEQTPVVLTAAGMTANWKTMKLK